MGKRGDRFASWFVALPKGRKFILSAIMASTTILSPVLLMAPTVSWGQINEMNANPEQFVALFRSVCPSY